MAGEQVVSESWVNAALAVHRKANESQDYGYLFWRRDYRTNNTRGMHQQTVRLLEEYVLPDLACRPG